MAVPTHYSHTVLKDQTFVLPTYYSDVKPLGLGAYGCVVKAKRTNPRTADETWLAIKKIKSIFAKKILTKRCLREMKLLLHLRGHAAIVTVLDAEIIYDEHGSFSEVYLYEELCATTLSAIIASRQPLGDLNFSSFLHQIFAGLKWIHSANVLHRDIKPDNILINADGSLKICDFGLSRGFASPCEETGVGMMSEYVATRWYRAPEIMLSQGSYTPAVDIWSAGCILAELLGGKPIFKGKDVVTQLNMILDVVGTPSHASTLRTCSHRTSDYLFSLPYRPPTPLSDLFPCASSLALDLLGKCLAFDPTKRIGVVEALEHEYLAEWHRYGVEAECSSKFDAGFEATDDIEGMMALIEDEVRFIRALVRNPHATSSSSLLSATPNVSTATDQPGLGSHWADGSPTDYGDSYYLEGRAEVGDPLDELQTAVEYEGA